MLEIKHRRFRLISDRRDVVAIITCYNNNPASVNGEVWFIDANLLMDKKQGALYSIMLQDRKLGIDIVLVANSDMTIDRRIRDSLEGKWTLRFPEG